MDAFEDPTIVIANELEARCKRNPNYSLRAFASSLQVSPSSLSMILNGKRQLSYESAGKIADRLGLSPKAKNLFLQNLALQKLGDKVPSASLDKDDTFRNLSLDQYELIAEWQHYAILSLIETRDFRPDIRWIAKRLGINPQRVKSAVERLKRLNLLDTTTDRWRQVGEPIKVDNSVSTVATRKAHHKILDKAMSSLNEDDIEIRSFSAATMAIDPKLVPMAKKKINAFRRQFMRFLEENSDKKAEVYHLAIQLYPVSKIRRKN